ncbi:glycosyltransferase 87 family protein [Solwaraspora sp. WMMA2056]|uniref:glycosyltransferase 87 family protein n=1 Tax=Solwaraspora sp. WMMA2056 TaxID=3015161 RepID=UPI00259B0E12|nr:glycosyltransferase 87 family protein [Solwaraspora sp. WMMA2056]WJK41792.1 glycosyltransferase 87 family protein [Solwaraspora sp. WMMA2056]
MVTDVRERVRRLTPLRRRQLGRVRDAWRGLDRATLLRLGLIALTCYAAWYAIGMFGRPYNFFDMRIYHGAMLWWTNGGELYEFIAPETTLGFTYPPFAGLTMLPMALVPMLAAGWINVLLGITALALVLAVLLGPIADRCGWPRWFAVGLAVPLAVAIEPARETLGYGQVNLLLFGLIIADLVALRWRAAPTPHRLATGGPLRRIFFSGIWAGAGIGLATSIKLTPALFIVYLLVTRQWRAATTAIGTAALVTVGAMVVATKESAAYFTSVLWDTGRVGVADMTPNQSLAGVLARLYDSMQTPGLLWFSFAALLLALGLSRAAHAHADGDELTAFTLIGLTANVISPISWSHHLVFVIPAIIVLADAALRRRSASQGLISRRTYPPTGPGISGVAGLRTPIWFPALTGLRHAAAAVALYLLFLISPIWPYEHKLPQVSHYHDGLWGVLMENSLGLALIALVAALPWRPGAEPAFYLDPRPQIRRRLTAPTGRARTGS